MSQANLKKNSSRQEDMIYSVEIHCGCFSILEKQPQFIFLKDELNFTIIQKYFKKFQIICVNRPYNE